MTIAQIASIISLLLAFGVSQPVVDNVQSILEASSAPTTTQPTQTAPQTQSPQKFSSAPVDSTPVQPQPNVTIPSMEVSVGTPQLVVQPDALNGLPYGTYRMRVQVLDNGVAQNEVPVSMSDGTTVKDATIDTRLTPDSVDYYHNFSYEPQTTGAHTLTFTSGDISSQITINVQ